MSKQYASNQTCMCMSTYSLLKLAKVKTALLKGIGSSGVFICKKKYCIVTVFRDQMFSQKMIKGRILVALPSGNLRK